MLKLTEDLHGPLNVSIALVHSCFVCVPASNRDISADVPMELLEKYDVKLNDAILADPGGKHMPLYDELVADHKVQYIAGGAGQNSCRVAQWMFSSPTRPLTSDAWVMMLTVSSSLRAVRRMEECLLPSHRQGEDWYVCCAYQRW